MVPAQILGHFNEDYTEENCGNCDQCIEFAPLQLAASHKKSAAVEDFHKGHTSDSEYDADLFALLRQVRTAEASRLRVAPYMVFGDKSLRDMAKHKPQTNEAFLTIHGVGDKKLKKFGAIFMDTITEYERT
jgi:ATP-dependent DNA helicase RecQ